MKMNARLLAYLRSLGLAGDASAEDGWEFFSELRGVQRSIANCLNYVEEDNQARTNCDLAIRSLGYDPSNPAQLLSEPSPAPAPAPTQPNAVEAERSRVRSILDLAEVSGVRSELSQQAVTEGWEVERARTAFVEDFRARSRANVPPEPPAGHVADRTLQVETLECALLHRNNVDPTQNLFRNNRRVQANDNLHRSAEAAWQYRNASLADLVRLAGRIDNVRGLPETGAHGLLQAYAENYGRAMSTSALSAIFTTSINSELMAAYDVTVDSTLGGWVRDTDVGDFRPNERVRLENGVKLDKLSRGGEANHAEYDDNFESFKIARYAKQFVIDEQDIIDDNFGGLAGFVPADMGVAARQLRPDMVYGLLLANAAMRDTVALFHADHGNLTTSSALAVETLQTAIKKMMLQAENGRTLNIMPRFLIVPPALVWRAKELLKSASVVIAGDTDTVRGNYNALSEENIVVVPEARLENGVTAPDTGTAHAGSASTWFLAAAAASHTIEFAYLRGTGRAPVVRSFGLTQGRWGIGWDINHDIGAKALDWRGLAKVTA